MAVLRTRIEMWAQIAGLLATAWLVWPVSVAPLRIGHALWIAFCALAWSAVIAVTLRQVMQYLHAEESDAAISATAAAAVWFAPASILLLQFTLPGLTAGLVLVVSAARLLCAPSAHLPVDPLSGHFVPALGISVGLEVAALSFWIGHPLPAVALFVLSVAMLTAVAIGLGAWVEDRPPNLPRSVLGLGLTFLLALMMGPGAGGWGWGFGSGSGTGVADRIAAPRPGNVQPKTTSQTAANLPGDYPGVILWPEIKPVTTLIAPMPSTGAGFARQSRPLTIPFGGEYWMFRWPYQRPPQSSHFQRGTPAALSFSTPDHFPMQMEARQKLPQPISVSCCSLLQIAILNKDPVPKSISLELILIDRNSQISLDLGRALVTSETLDFPFPAAPSLDEFDEIRVIFHRTTGRMDKSARIAIERFILVPRG
jgi:hypothetical protein